MAKILVLCNNYGKNNDATGICIKNVVEEFVKQGNDVFCIRESFEKKISSENIHFYGIKSSFFSRVKILKDSSNKWKRLLFFVISIVRHLLLVPLYPNVAYFRSRKYLSKAIDLIELEKIDLVIAVYRPFEAIYALLKLKKIYGKNIFTVAYHLDLLKSVNTKNRFVRHYQEFRAKRIVEKEKKCFDMLVFPEAIKGKDFSEKNNIYYADFPVYVDCADRESFELPYNSDFINVVFIGSLNIQNRNPLRVIEYLEAYNCIAIKKIQWHIWGNIEENIKKEFEKKEFIKYHGLLENNKVLYALENSDFIINVSNDLTLDMVPSKTFQYFSTRKPILNFVKSKRDASIPYFEKYGSTLNVFVNDNFDENEKRMDSFINKQVGKNADFGEDLLKKCTPSYFVNLVRGATNV